MPSPYEIVICQDNPPSPSSMATAHWSSTRTNSSYSNQSKISITTNSSSPQTAPSVPPPTSKTKPAKPNGEHANGIAEFVQTNRPHGGNPNGGPRQHPQGYTRISIKNVTIHNSGGQSEGNCPVLLSPEFANGPEHTWNCIKDSRLSDGQGICHCPPKTDVTTFK